VHEQNLKLVHDYWKDKTLPEASPSQADWPQPSSSARGSSSKGSSSSRRS
jgi:hypothetical protein